DDPSTWLAGIYGRVAGRGDFLSSDELAVFAGRLGASGLTGQLNLYRNIDRNLEDVAALVGRPITQPTLMVTADRDPVLPASMADGMVPLVADLERAHIDDCGHWTQQERPDQVNEVLLDWLGRRVPA
ncbi:MAG: alpha/beta hydrolase, partial [Acidimicrobiia bacterium]|nr:alpha/beta hydrolase [Acidimicrobiia bacterium]